MNLQMSHIGKVYIGIEGDIIIRERVQSPKRSPCSNQMSIPNCMPLRQLQFQALSAAFFRAALSCRHCIPLFHSRSMRGVYRSGGAQNMVFRSVKGDVNEGEMGREMRKDKNVDTDECPAGSDGVHYGVYQSNAACSEEAADLSRMSKYL